ncbi:MAG: dTDP-4-dehydrorhamnose reductase [Rhodobacteraceae bacterium]|nr:dTDP-4-dehydrorhamnose reductase [Paracoccaceae bacterium]
MKLLVFGKTGQVATELQRQADVTAVGRDQADLTDPEACAAVIAASDADAVINAAAYTAVDKAETDEETAALVNGAAPTAMAQAAAAKGIPFVHISTDYVFDGSGDAPWTVDAATGPLGVYGQTKLDGEDGVRAAGGQFAILRTSWVFSAHGNNFVKTMLRLGAERDRLTIVADQIGGPTSAADIAGACLTMARMLAKGQGTPGTYHFSGGPDVSWADFAREIFAQATLTPEVIDIPSSEFPTPAQRPGNSRMDCSALDTAFGIPRPDWRDSLKSVLSDLFSKDHSGQN